MAIKKKYTSISSDISYHDYILLISLLDSGLEEKIPPKKFYKGRLCLKASSQFKKLCYEYFRGLRGGFNDYNKYNSKFAIDGKKESAYFDNYLYNPICNISFGHTQDLILTLIDDFTPLESLTSDIQTAVIKTSIGFCPKIQSLNLDSLYAEILDKGDSESYLKDIFCDIHTLIDDKNILEKSKSNENGDLKFDPIIHSFQNQMPLVSFTKFKINSIATIGNGLFFQNRIYSTMAKRLLLSVKEIKREISQGKFKNLIKNEDFNTLKCSFFDIQGTEEIGLLIFTSNYSLSTSIIAALKTLTFRDLGTLEEEKLKDEKYHYLFETDPLLKELFKINADDKKNKGKQQYYASHLFNKTYSILAFSHNTYIKPEKTFINGYTEATCQFEILPGHNIEVEKRVNSKRKDGNIIADNLKSFNDVNVYRYTIGSDDLSVNIPYTILKSSHKKVNCIHLKKLFKIIYSLHEKGYKTGYIAKMRTELCIPIPRFKYIKMKVGGKHAAVFSKLADTLRQSLFEEANGSLNKDNLVKALKRLKMPYSLKLSISYLFQNFAINLNNPEVIENVLDLCDAFVSFHAILIKQSTNLRKRGTNNPIFDSLELSEISLFINSLQNSMMQRLTGAFRIDTLRESAIDFRGGLNQILTATHVPFKCGLEMVRKCISTYSSSDLIVSGAIRIGFDPRTICHRLDLSSEKQALLTSVVMNIGHILHPASFCDYIHEAFHLLLDGYYINKSLDKPIGTLFENYNDVNDMYEHKKYKVLVDRVSEVFSLLMCHLFIFGNNVNAFLRHYISQYTKSPATIYSNDIEDILQFTEQLIRFFIVTDFIENKQGKEGNDIYHWNSESNNFYNNNLSKSKERFKKMVTNFGPFYSKFNKLWLGEDGNGELIKKYCIDMFEDIYPRFQKEYMPSICRTAIRSYKIIFKNMYKFTKKDLILLKKIDNEIINSLKDGKPLIRRLYNYSNLTEKKDKNATDFGLNYLYLLCRLLYFYINTTNETVSWDINKRIHIYREFDNGKLSYLLEDKYDKPKPWNIFQLEVGRPSSSCVHPDARRAKLRTQISLLKTLWDMSCNMKARTLLELIKDSKA